MIDVGWILIEFVVTSVCVTCIVIKLEDAVWKADCVRRGFARYNSTTGEWEWIEADIEKVV